MHYLIKISEKKSKLDTKYNAQRVLEITKEDSMVR